MDCKKLMTAIKIDTGTGTITIDLKEKKIYLQEDFDYTIIAENSGLPGVIGPNINININKTLQDIKEKAIETTFRHPDGP